MRAPGQAGEEAPPAVCACVGQATCASRRNERGKQKREEGQRDMVTHSVGESSTHRTISIQMGSERTFDRSHDHPQ